MLTLVNFTHVNKIEAMYERPRVNVRVERGSTFTFMHGLSYIDPISFYARTHGKISWWWKSTLSLKVLNVDHSIVNGDVYRRDMLTEKFAEL